MTRFILLTGKIGAGKSYVAAMLRNKHYIVLDTDKVAKDRMEQDSSGPLSVGTAPNASKRMASWTLIICVPSCSARTDEHPNAMRGP